MMTTFGQLYVSLSDDKPAEDSDETYTKLLKRHQSAQANRFKHSPILSIN